jgi:nitrate reductase gamma subunit
MGEMIHLALPAFELFSYTVLTVFAVALLAKVLSWASMPLHLRWELYPVAHEPNNYGGSYMEDLDWWTKKRNTTTVGMLKELLMEMLFIKRLFVHKRKLWYFSFAFHFGIYLILAWFVLLFLRAATSLYSGALIASNWPLAQVLYYLTMISGSVGMIATIVGGVGVGVERLADREMREYSAPADYFNLAFVVTATALGFASWVLFDPTFAVAKQFMTALVSFGQTTMPRLSTLTQLQIVMVGLLFMYIPFTKMTHFIGKYFTYHAVLWDDTPNLRGSRIEKRVKENLGYQIRWRATHLNAGRTWAEDATQPVSSGKKIERKPNEQQ